MHIVEIRAYKKTKNKIRVVVFCHFTLVLRLWNNNFLVGKEPKIKLDYFSDALLFRHVPSP